VVFVSNILFRQGFQGEEGASQSLWKFAEDRRKCCAGERKRWLGAEINENSSGQVTKRRTGQLRERLVAADASCPRSGEAGRPVGGQDEVT